MRSLFEHTLPETYIMRKEKEDTEQNIYRELQILEQMEFDPRIGQRNLSQKLGIALGLANLLIKSMVQKGYVKASKLGWKRWVYIVTPAGFTRKLQLTLAYIDRFFDQYKNVRELLKHQLGNLDLNSESRIALLGNKEFTELAYICLRDMGVTEIDVISESGNEKFLGNDTIKIENIDLTNHNSIILGAHKNSIENKELLINKGIPESRITLLLDHTSSILNTDELESS